MGYLTIGLGITMFIFTLLFVSMFIAPLRRYMISVFTDETLVGEFYDTLEEEDITSTSDIWSILLASIVMSLLFCVIGALVGIAWPITIILILVFIYLKKKNKC